VADEQGSAAQRVTRADRALEGLAQQYPDIERERPAILDLAARVLSRCHDELDGRVCELTAVMSAKHARETLRGERPAASLLFLCELALDEPEALAAGIAELLGPAGFEVRPLGQAVPPRRLALASAIRETAEAFAVATAAEENGIDPEEQAVVIRELDQAGEALAQTRAAYAREEKQR
jgi:hypothetical protein